MRSYVFSVAFIAAAVAPVMSVPIAGSQSTQPTPTPTALAVNQSQPAQVPPAPANLVDEFLSSLTTGQLQDLTAIVQAALNSSDPAVPMPTDSSTPSQPTPVVQTDVTLDEPERRQLGDLFGILGKNAAKGASKVGEKVAESAVKRALEPTPIAKTDFTRPFFGLGPEVIKDLPELERRQWGDLFGLLGKAAAKAGLKVGEKVVESDIKSSVKRTPAPIPNAKRHWTPPSIPTPPPIPSCWRTESCD